MQNCPILYVCHGPSFAARSILHIFQNHNQNLNMVLNVEQLKVPFIALHSATE